MAFQFHLIVLSACFLGSATSLLTVSPSRLADGVRAYLWIWVAALATLTVPCTIFSLFFSEDDRFYVRFFDEKYLACYLALIVVPWIWMLYLRVGKAPKLPALTPATAVALLSASAILAATVCLPLRAWREAELRAMDDLAFQGTGYSMKV